MVAARYTRNNQDALDVLQNALIKIYQNLSSFDSSLGNFTAWSTKIVINESIMFLRKRKQLVSLEDIRVEDNTSVFEFEHPAHLNSEAITKLVQLLPDGYRLVFNLHVVEGYTHAEIAQILRISVGTSKSQYYKARKILKQQIEVLI